MSVIAVQLGAAELATFGLLTVAIVALWVRPGVRGRVAPPLWQAAFVAAVATAAATGIVEWQGILALAVVYGTARLAQGETGPGLAARLVLLVGCLALVAHLVPGFDNPKIIDRAMVSQDGLPYTKYLNFDKAAVGLILLGFGVELARTRDQWRELLRGAAPVAAGAVAVLMPLSFVLGYVRWDPGWPPALAVWAWTNLLFTCVAEEAIFRGLVQRRLALWLRRHGWSDLPALFTAAVLFGLAHWAGGARYVLLSTAAGLGYGLAYRRTGRIEASILTHFLVNLAHYAFFTYPALAGVAG